MARRSGLGKGLGALIPAEVARDRSSTLREVSISSIRPNPLQPRTRFDEEAMTSLASSIREVGVLQPVLVREAGTDDYELIAGERRWRAARRAGLQTMPVLVQTVSDVHSLEQALVENLHREDLNALEEAAAFQQLVDEFDYTHEQVAARVGKSRTTVTNTLRLLQLPAGVQRALADGTISAGHARALLGTPDRSFQEELAKRAVAEGLTVRAVEESIRRHVQGAEADLPEADLPEAANGVPVARQEAAPRVPDARTEEATGDAGTRRRLPAPGVLELEDLLSNHLNTRVKVDMGAKRGRVLVEFATLEDLERIYKLMVGGGPVPPGL
ncbi:MAG TPA: ParB/RepB/Spo0J family partition protein [Acidimicrobiales bacterium]|nr:ParB/RepB/Spo0J family partition protein [Acidimicrobiales bacterium]